MSWARILRPPPFFGKLSSHLSFKRGVQPTKNQISTNHRLFRPPTRILHSLAGRVKRVHSKPNFFRKKVYDYCSLRRWHMRTSPLISTSYNFHRRKTEKKPTFRDVFSEGQKIPQRSTIISLYTQNGKAIRIDGRQVIIDVPKQLNSWVEHQDRLTDPEYIFEIAFQKTRQEDKEIFIELFSMYHPDIQDARDAVIVTLCRKVDHYSYSELKQYIQKYREELFFQPDPKHLADRIEIFLKRHREAPTNWLYVMREASGMISTPAEIYSFVQLVKYLFPDYDW